MTPSRTRGPLLMWTFVGALGTVALVALAVGCHLLLGHPTGLLIVTAGALGAIPAGVVAGLLPVLRDAANRALHAAMVATGLIAVVVSIYLVVVVGFGGTPTGDQRGVLGLSVVAAVVAVVLVEPSRQRLFDLARRVTGESPQPVAMALETFGARMTRAVPLDELLLQLAETLHSEVAPAGSEIWTGTGGQLELTVSVPERSRDPMRLGVEECEVTARTRAAGTAWIGVWLPQLLVGRSDAVVRVAPIAHLGDLLGLIVVVREAGASPFTDDEDQTMANLARQLGLGLHNVRLDSALQASLEDLRASNNELTASRARIVAAADASRLAIERNLHDGAQQHLVALAVKLGLAEQILGETAPAVSGLLSELRQDVQTTIGEVRELAHGIYPPLLRDRGLSDALSTVAARSPLAVSLDAQLSARYAADVEAAAYFCCLEAISNAGKHAGAGAHVDVVLMGTAAHLVFDVCDDGVGFEPTVAGPGHGFINMGDRLGAIGGTLTVSSAPGSGTRVRGEIPCRPILSASAVQ